MGSNLAIVAGQLVLTGKRMTGAVVVVQWRSGVSSTELEDDFPQLSRTALDYAEIQARLPKPPGRPRKALLLQRA